MGRPAFSGSKMGTNAMDKATSKDKKGLFAGQRELQKPKNFSTLRRGRREKNLKRFSL